MNINRSISTLKDCPDCDGGVQPALTGGQILRTCSTCGGSGKLQEGSNIGSAVDGVIFYLDQNIISEMREGTYQIPKHRIFDLSQQLKHSARGVIRYAYSDETLSEIARTGRAAEYLQQLEALEARKLLEFHDLQNPQVLGKTTKITGKLQPLIEYVEPALFYDFYIERLNAEEELTRDSMLFANMVLHVASLLDIDHICFDITKVEEPEKRAELFEIVRQIRAAINAPQINQVPFKKPDNPIRYIWEKLIKPNIKSSRTTENIFFSFHKPDSVSSNLVNAHIVLNIIGYFPDDNKKLISNIQGFMSDVRHVNMAQRTDVFLTYDNNLAHRAAALYKWENAKSGFNMMTVFKRFGKRDVLNYVASEGETADQASDRSICLYTDGVISYTT